jgi:cell division protein FtsW (lipid II flippase)
MFAFSASNQAIRRGTPQGRYHLGVVLAAVMLATLGVIMVASSSIAIADNQNAKPFYYLSSAWAWGWRFWLHAPSWRRSSNTPSCCC